jgi:hypothetical protein
MAIQYNFLAPIDQKVRDRGYDFVSQNKYLQDGFKSTDDISYEGDGSPVSYANSMGGIMTQAPIPGPLKYIPEGDGGGRDPDGPAPDTGAVTADDYGYGPVGDMGMTEEEQADVDSVKNAKIGKLGIAKTIGSFAMFGPFAAMIQARKENKKAKQAAIEAAKYGKEHDYEGRDNDYGTHTSTISAAAAAANQDRGRGKGTTGGYSTSAHGAAMHGADGGRVGYFFGGRVKYKSGGRVSFKNGGLASIL